MKKYLLTLTLLLTTTIAVNAQCSAGEVEIQIEIQTDAYGYEGYWELVPKDSSCGQGIILSGGNSLVGCDGGNAQNQPGGGYNNNQLYTSPTACLIEGNEYSLHYVDDWGDGGFVFTVKINGYYYQTFEDPNAATVAFDFIAQEPPAYDAVMMNSKLDLYMQPGDVDIEVEIHNAGTATIQDVTLNYQVDNGSVVSQQITGLSIPNNTSQIVTHPTAWSPSTAGEYDLKIWHSEINGNSDANPGNDELETTVHIGPARPNVIDSYLVNLPLVVEIADASEDINLPTDLDFHPILTKKELWVLNKDNANTGSSTVTISNAGESNQSELWRRDGNAWHFMSLSTGIAFSNNGNFGTSPGVYDANHNGGQPFTGPALWSSDPAIYAQPSGGNGSHLDMLHESPECQGIAHEIDNVFWVFDGYNGDIVRYDFAEDHGPGNDDHSDGEIIRFSEEEVEKDGGDDVVSHLEYDKATDWLYVVDHGNDRVLRINTKSGTLGGTPNFGPFEPLAMYRHQVNYDWEVIADTGFTDPSGLALIGDRLLVGDYDDGSITIFDIGQTPVVRLKKIYTGAEGLQGITIGPEGKIWFVDYEDESVSRVDWVPDTTTGIAQQTASVEFSLFPNPTTGAVHLVNPIKENVDLEVFDLQGKRVAFQTIGSGQQRVDLDVAPGLYIVYLSQDGVRISKTERLVRQ